MNFSKILQLTLACARKGLKAGWALAKKALAWSFQSIERFIAVALGIVLLVTWFNYKKVTRDYEKELASKKGEIEEYENKIGELYAENSASIGSIRDLKRENADLYEEIKHLKDNPIVITKTKIEYIQTDVETKTDTVFVEKDGTITAEFSYHDEWLGLDGTTKVNGFNARTKLDKIRINEDLTLDLIEKDGRLSIIAKSQNPYVKINNVDGAVVSPEKSKALARRFDGKWAIVAGAGPSVTMMDGNLKLVPAVSLTIGYKIWGF